MALETTFRTCPHCIERIDLTLCDVVATAAPEMAGAGSSASPLAWGDSDDAHEESEEFVGSTSSSSVHPEYRMIKAAVAPDPASSGSSWFGKRRSAAVIQPVATLGSPEDIPRRLCPKCHGVLPPELDQRDALVLAVLGVVSAGKTSYIATALNQAVRKGALSRFGCRKFAPIGATAMTLHNDYERRMFRDRKRFEPNKAEDELKPMLFEVEYEHEDPFLLVVHDLSGEVVSNHTRRAVQLGRLRRAGGIIFLLDPFEFEEVRDLVPTQLIPADRSVHQVDLLSECLKEVRERGDRNVPLSVAVSKSDILRDYCDLKGSWEGPPDMTEPFEMDIKRVSDEVKAMLMDLGEQQVMAAVTGHGRVTYHAVSAFGFAPTSVDFGDKPQPLRVGDPLGLCIHLMLEARGARLR